MLRGIVELHGLAGGFPNHFEVHSRGSSNRVQRRPARLINDRDIVHLESDGVSVGSDGEASFGHRNNPVEPGRRDGRVKIVNLIGRDRRPLKKRKSYMGEDAALGGASSPVFALHHAVVGGGAAEGDAISMIVCTDAGEGAATRDAAIEMVDVRRLEIEAGGLIVTAVFVEPGNWVWVGTAVGGGELLRRRLRGVAADCEWKKREAAVFQGVSAGEDGWSEEIFHEEVSFREDADDLALIAGFVRHYLRPGDTSKATPKPRPPCPFSPNQS